MDLLSTLAALDGDVQTTLARFGGKEALLAKFVLKFPDDPTYGQIMQALAQEDYDALEAASHTLKGVAANLGFTALSQSCDTLVKALRGGQRDAAALQSMAARITDFYQIIVQAIRAID